MNGGSQAVATAKDTRLSSLATAASLIQPSPAFIGIGDPRGVRWFGLRGTSSLHVREMFEILSFPPPESKMTDVLNSERRTNLAVSSSKGCAVTPALRGERWLCTNVGMQELTNCVRGRSPQVAKEEFDDLRPAHRTICPHYPTSFTPLYAVMPACLTYSYHVIVSPFLSVPSTFPHSIYLCSGKQAASLLSVPSLIPVWRSSRCWAHSVTFQATHTFPMLDMWTPSGDHICLQFIFFPQLQPITLPFF
ncbi:hypothetical protein O3P69_004464 [Scylla paramamosain]|uniref:Uncharacterized protein n=1 Tax=Scylla paramamosain TaxID=85552 RepID=A0AAW0UD98_SCYPA